MLRTNEAEAILLRATLLNSIKGQPGFQILLGIMDEAIFEAEEEVSALAVDVEDKLLKTLHIRNKAMKTFREKFVALVDTHIEAGQHIANEEEQVAEVAANPFDEIHAL